MINNLEKRDPGKKQYWELRSSYLDKLEVPRYHLVLIQNDHPWIKYDKFKISDIEYIVFDSKPIIQGYQSRTSHVSSTRIAFYKRLVSDPEITKIAEFGYRIEIFKKRLLREAISKTSGNTIQ